MIAAKIIAYFLLKGYPLSSIRFLVKQFQLETANGTSRLFFKNNNLFGMSCPLVRPTTIIGCDQLSDGNTNGVFRSLTSCMKDRRQWDTYFNIDINSPSYGQDVSNIYHPDSDYFDHVVAISNDVFRKGLMICLLPFPIITILYLIHV